jgi:hypothetical protein
MSAPTDTQIKFGKTEPKLGPWPERPKRPEHIKSVTTLRTPKGARLCGSVLRTPGSKGDWLCHQPGMLTNGRCKMHGGKVPAGVASPTFKHGRQSKVLRDLGIAEMFANFRDDPELAELNTEIALVDIQIEKALRRNAKTDTEKTRKELLATINARRKLVDSKHKNTSAVVPVERVLAFMHAMVNLVFEFVTDPRQKSAFLHKIRALSGRPTDQLANASMLDALPKADAIDVPAPPATEPSNAS